MNKILIPAILSVTILMAGMFAFMPIEKASTAHSPSLGVVETETTPISGTQASFSVAGTQTVASTIIGTADRFSACAVLDVSVSAAGGLPAGVFTLEIRDSSDATIDSKTLTVPVTATSANTVLCTLIGGAIKVAVADTTALGTQTLTWFVDLNTKGFGIPIPT